MEDFSGYTSFNYLAEDNMLTNFCKLAENISHTLPKNESIIQPRDVTLPQPMKLCTPTHLSCFSAQHRNIPWQPSKINADLTTMKPSDPVLIELRLIFLAQNRNVPWQPATDNPTPSQV